MSLSTGRTGRLWKDPRSFRDLTKPVGALSQKRLTYFRERMAGMPENQEPLGGG